MFARVVMFVSAMFLFTAVSPATSFAHEAGNRVPAAAKHKKEKKKGKKAKKTAVKKKAKAARVAKAKKRATHAPSHESSISHTPPEMKDDLPPPSVESTTEQ